jgi:hypothetical protein
MHKEDHAFSIVSISNLLLANTGEVSTCHTERRSPKREEGEVFSMAELADGVGQRRSHDSIKAFSIRTQSRNLLSVRMIC